MYSMIFARHSFQDRWVIVYHSPRMLSMTPDTKRQLNVGLISVQRRRRWANIKLILVQRFVCVFWDTTNTRFVRPMDS